jgi:hypothetical protein
MPFVCPECRTPGSLKITHRIELPSDSRSDEIAVQIVKCSRCPFHGVAVYEESRRGALDSESVDHYGYKVKAADLKSLINKIKKCPNPKNARCRCPSHRSLGRTNSWGRWQGLADIKVQGTFPMDLI